MQAKVTTATRVMRRRMRAAAALFWTDAWPLTRASGRSCGDVARDGAAMADADPVGEVTAFTEIARKLANPEMKATVPAKKPATYKSQYWLTVPPNIPWLAPTQEGNPTMTPKMTRSRDCCQVGDRADPVGEVTAFTEIARKLANPEMKAMAPARKPATYKTQYWLTVPPNIPWLAATQEGNPTTTPKITRSNDCCQVGDRRLVPAGIKPLDSYLTFSQSDCIHRRSAGRA